MLLYRVAPYRESAGVGEPGHPSYFHRPQTGRWDNPHYDTVYLSAVPSGAVGETFGQLANWRKEMFVVPHTPGAVRSLLVFAAPDDLSILDFDDAHQLVAQSMRPTQVVIRNPAYTHGVAARLYSEADDAGVRKWLGVKWWSYYRPAWTNYALWAGPGEQSPLTFTHAEELDLGHPAVGEAAESLAKNLFR